MLEFKVEYLSSDSYRRSLMLSLAQDAGYSVKTFVDPMDWPTEPSNPEEQIREYSKLMAESMNSKLLELYKTWLSDSEDELVAALRATQPDLVIFLEMLSLEKITASDVPMFDLFELLYSKKVPENVAAVIQQASLQETDQTGEVDMSEPTDKIIENLRRGEDVMEKINQNVKALQKGRRIKLVATYNGRY